MSFWNLIDILKLSSDLRCWRLLRDVRREYGQDPHFTLRRMVRCSLAAINGEKVIKTNGHWLISSFLPPVTSRAFMTMLLATPDCPARFRQQALVKRTAPFSTYIALTNRCNYDCVHCSVKGRMTGPELSTEEWLRVISDLQDMGTGILGFTGGEPLLRDDLERIVSAVDDRSVTYVFTNGHSLTRERARDLRHAGLFGIGISLDSADQEAHDKIRGHEGAAASALAAMENASAAGLHVMAQTVVGRESLRPENETHLLRLFRLAQQHGAREVRLLEPICSGSLLHRSDGHELFYSPEDRRAMISLQERINRRRGWPKISAFAHTESAHRYGCGAGNQHSYIGPDGQLYPCDFLPLSFGNVRDHGVRELWQEMTAAVGIPKEQCFALTLHSLLRERNGDGQVIPKLESEQICRERQSTEYPGFFKALQK